MSTPRTDGIEGEAYQYKWDCRVVHSEFARQLETELEAERDKVAKLKDIIRRASTKFFEDGPDGVIAAEMFRILGESRNELK